MSLFFLIVRTGHSFYPLTGGRTGASLQKPISCRIIIYPAFGHKLPVHTINIFKFDVFTTYSTKSF